MTLKKRKCPHCGKSFLGNEYENHIFKCKVRKQKKKAIENIFDELLENIKVEVTNKK